MLENDSDYSLNDVMLTFYSELGSISLLKKFKKLAVKKPD